MRSQLDVRLGAVVPVLMHRPPDVHSLDAAMECIELADAYGVCDGHPLAESQRITLENALGERADGSWAAATIADFGPRQGTGKNDKIAARELAGLIAFGERLIIHTAHEFATANESFLRLVAVFENYDDLRKKVARIRYANGEQGIELLSGQRLKYRARTGGGGRGFAKADLIVYDEAQHLQQEQLGASGPAKLANPNSQTWYAGSGGLSTSRQAWALRTRAVLGDAGRLAYTEMTGESIEVVDGRIVCTAPDPRDIDAWYASMPGLGRWVTEESMWTQFDELGPEMFARECLCVWDALPDAMVAPKLPRDAWAASATLSKPQGRKTLMDGPLVVGFDVDLDGEHASISLAAGTIAEPYIECVEHRRQVGWLAQRLVEVVQNATKDGSAPIAVAYNAAGPALEAVGAVTVAMRDAGLSTDLLVPLAAQSYRAACGHMFTAVTEGTLRRSKIDQGPLDLAASDATERPLAEGWVWHRRQATVPISPLVAATVACHLLPVEAEPVLEFKVF